MPAPQAGLPGPYGLSLRLACVAPRQGGAAITCPPDRVPPPRIRHSPRPYWSRILRPEFYMVIYDPDLRTSIKWDKLQCLLWQLQATDVVNQDSFAMGV